MSAIRNEQTGTGDNEISILEDFIPIKEIIESNDPGIESENYGKLLRDLPLNYIIISHRLDDIMELIKRTVVNKEDIEKSTREIISQQKKEIFELKSLLQNLIHELNKRSISNILMWISIAGLIISLSFLFLSVFQGEVILLSFHFILLSIVFCFILAMTFFSKRVYK